MAVAVAVRNARERQAPTKHRLEEMVASSSKALQEQKVLVLKMGACHLYAPRDTDLMNTDLKLKFRMQDITHLKATGEKTITHRDESHHLVFSNLGSTVYEGGNLEFDLCIPHRLWGKSTVIARCKISLQDALASFRDDSADKPDGLNLELVAVETPGKVVANIVVGFGIEVSTLQDAGGIDALKMSAVPPEPVMPVMSTRMIFNLDEYNVACRSYASQTKQTQKNLQDVLMSASPLLSAPTPLKGQGSQRHGSTGSRNSDQLQWSGERSQRSQRRSGMGSTNSEQEQSSAQRSFASDQSHGSALGQSLRSCSQGEVLLSDLLEYASTSSGSSSQTISL